MIKILEKDASLIVICPLPERALNFRFEKNYFKADMNSDILLQTAAIFIFYVTFIRNRVLAKRMSWLISFAWASSGCKDRTRDLQNEKFFLLTAGLELTNIGLWSHHRKR